MTSTPGPGARMRTGIAMLCLALSAIALQRGATMPWLSATTADGAALSVSPIGLIRADAGGVTECRWWPRLGDETLCEVAAEGTMAAVRRSYPLVFVALWTAIGGLFLAALAVPRSLPWLPAVVAAGASMMTVGAIWSLSLAPQALAALSGVTAHFAGGGIMAVGAAAVMTTLASLLLLDARRIRR